MVVGGERVELLGGGLDGMGGGMIGIVEVGA